MFFFVAFLGIFAWLFKYVFALLAIGVILGVIWALAYYTVTGDVWT
jgi:hypothetical protein